MMRIQQLYKDLEQEHFSRGNSICKGPKERISSGQLQNEKKARVPRTQNKGKAAADKMRDTDRGQTAVSPRARDENADGILRAMQNHWRVF